MTFFQDPMAVLAVCMSICAAVFWTGRTAWGARLFRIIPSIVWVYYLPTLAAAMGWIPSDSAAYEWMRDYLLPFSLVILMVSTDVSAILKVGPRAVTVMLFGTAGVVVGGPVALLIFGPWLPPETWKGFAALSGSWIGGSGNFAALIEAVEAPDSIVGPIIIVDTVMAYTWMGVLLFLVNHQRVIDAWNRASSDVVEELNRRLRDFREKTSRPISLPDVLLVLAVGFSGTVLCRYLAERIYQTTQPVLAEQFPNLASIFSSFTWLVILVSVLGIGLSFTPLRRMERAGSSHIAYAALFLFLTSIGAGAELGGILAAPALLLAGMVWMLIHIAFLVLGARLMRAPMFLIAVGSQANIGGPPSASIVAAAYYESMAPVGVLMGVFGYVIGSYAGLLCAYLLRLVS